MTIKTKLALVPVIIVTLVAVACGGSGQSAAPASGKSGAAAKGDAGRGRQLFTQSCTSCHGADAKGMPGLGKDLTTSAFSKGLSDAELVDFVKKGRPANDPANTTKVDMPPKGGNPALTDAQIADIVAYVRTLQR